MDWKPNVKKQIIGGFEHLRIDEKPPTVDSKLIINPATGDGWRAIDILEEVQQVLSKRGYALVHKPDAIRLVKMTPGAQQDGSVAHARVIAHVRHIAPMPFGIEWKDIEA